MAYFRFGRNAIYAYADASKGGLSVWLSGSEMRDIQSFHFSDSEILKIMTGDRSPEKKCLRIANRAEVKELRSAVRAYAADYPERVYLLPQEKKR